MTSDHIGLFKLSVTRAMKEQLIEVLDSLHPVPLDNQALQAVEQRGGIYQLLLDGESVYIGKSTSSLRARIEKHHGKLGGRVGFLVPRTTFRCVYVDEDLDALAPEKMLISAFKKAGKAPWNNNGFGNNDPGRRRDGSLVKENHFDSHYSIDLDIPVTLRLDKNQSLYVIMNNLKSALPYNFRFPALQAQERRELDAVFSDTYGVLTQTAREWFTWLADRMPDAWLVTALPGYVICYRETDPSVYGSRRESWMSTGIGPCIHAFHEPVYDRPGNIELASETE